jgi:hypothetical protein
LTRSHLRLAKTIADFPTSKIYYTKANPLAGLNLFPMAVVRLV